MAYTNLGGPRASIIDGNLRTPETSSQPRIVILGTASSGMSYELWSVTNVGQAEREFGSASEVMQGVHEAIAQGADNLAVMRIGGTLGSAAIVEGSDTLTLTPLLRDDTTLSRYKIAILDTGTRLLVYDDTDKIWVHDTNEELVINTGVIEVQNEVTAILALGDTLNALTGTGDAVLADPLTYIALADLVVADFPAAGGGTADSITLVAGTDQLTPTLPQRYAMLSQAYFALDWTDGDYVIPMGVYIDDNNLAEGFSYPGTEDLFFDPSASTSTALAYVWEYEYRGRLYTYFIESNSTGVMAALQAGVEADGAIADAVINVDDIVITARKKGVDGGKILIQCNAAGAAGPTVSVSYSTVGVPTILITDDGTATYAQAATAINASTEASKWVVASAGTAVTVNTFAATTIVLLGGLLATTTTAETPGVGEATLDPFDLVGEDPPTAVSNYFYETAGDDATDNQLRACNFAHQLATFCHHASTTWKALLGTIPFKGPTGITRTVIADWAGSLPTFTDLGLEEEIASGNDGSGILGNKYLAGLAGYRNSTLVSASNVNTGLAYGGLIHTVGESLPNGTDRPYGILDTDEAKDSNDKPIDLGKYLMVSYAWPVHRNNFNNGTPYRGPIHVTVAGKYAIMPENEEAIGRNGLVVKVASPPKVHATQENRLAGIGAVGLRRETNFGLLLTTGKTAAHPSSDFTDISTMRSLNRALNGIFEICKRFIGKDYTPERLQALQTAIDAFLRNETNNRFNQGAVAKLNYTIADRVLGKLTIRLRMVPPFSIRLIEVEASLAADESEL